MEGVNSVKPKNEEVLEHTTSEDTKHPLQGTCMLVNIQVSMVVVGGGAFHFSHQATL